MSSAYLVFLVVRPEEQGKEPVLGVASKENYSPVLWSWRFWDPIHKPELQARPCRTTVPYLDTVT